jgi:4-cresol dehydrogenase (hydroxylating)
LEDSVLLSLRRMDRILDFSETLGYVVLEPGVTFGGLAEFLRERQSDLEAPRIGAGPGASVLGNVLQRGIGKGAYEDMAARLLGLETVLWDGTVVSTQPAGQPWRSRMPGPALEGLFLQSDFGVVTQITLALTARPKLRQIGLFSLSVNELVDGIGALRRRHHERFEFQGINAVRLRGEGIDAKLDGADWCGVAFLSADDPKELQWRRRVVDAALARAHWLEPTSGDTEQTFDGLKPAYWAREMPVPDAPDPDTDGCGIIWITPVLPLDGPDVESAMEAVELTCRHFGFEPSISLRFLDARSVHAVIGLLYDRTVPGSDERATNAHRAVRDVLDRLGYAPYRLSLLDRRLSEASASDRAREVLRRMSESKTVGPAE